MSWSPSFTSFFPKPSGLWYSLTRLDYISHDPFIPLLFHHSHLYALRQEFNSYASQFMFQGPTFIYPFIYSLAVDHSVSISMPLGLPRNHARLLLFLSFYLTIRTNRADLD